MPSAKPKTVEITIRPLTPADWPHVAQLFGSNGACGGCWCMWQRVPKGGKTWKAAKGEKNRRSLKQLIEAGDVHAVLGFVNEQAIGWCCFGPRADFRRLETVRALRLDWTPATWAIVCFFIPHKWRGHGVATALLQAATERAFDLGATEVHGYPIDPKGKSAPAAFVWTGVPRLFVKAGYRKMRRPTGMRPIYVKSM